LNEEAFKNFNEKALVPCEHCQRTFLPDRLPIHARVCLKVFSKKAINLKGNRRLILGKLENLFPSINIQNDVRMHARTVQGVEKTY